MVGKLAAPSDVALLYIPYKVFIAGNMSYTEIINRSM